MKLPKPSAPFERLNIHGESISIDCNGKVLVLPTGNDTLPHFNEKTLASTRTCENFGGYNGSTPDYCPGTIYSQTDGVVLTDPSGNNSGSVIGAGVLSTNNYLSVDTETHTLSEEFIIVNSSTTNTATIIDDCSTTTSNNGTVGALTSLTTENGKLKLVGRGTNSSGLKLIWTHKNLTSAEFLTFSINSSVQKNLRVDISGGGNTLTWSGTSYTISPNIDTTFVLSLKSTIGGSCCPTSGVAPTSWEDVTIYIGTYDVDAADITLYFDNIAIDVHKTAYIEFNIPDKLNSTSLQIQCWDGFSYQNCGLYRLADTYNAICETANWEYLNGVTFVKVYGDGVGKSVYPTGSQSKVISGSSGTITYSANQGTRSRAGISVYLPPSDTGRTRFNQVRLLLIFYYTQDAHGHFSASYDFENSLNQTYGLQNINHPWIAIYNPNDTIIDFFLFSHKLKNLSLKKNETGVIHEITLYPGNGVIYHGQIRYDSLTRDTGSTLVPDIFKSTVNGSLPSLLAPYGVVI